LVSAAAPVADREFVVILPVVHWLSPVVCLAAGRGIRSHESSEYRAQLLIDQLV